MQDGSPVTHSHDTVSKVISLREASGTGGSGGSWWGCVGLCEALP